VSDPRSNGWAALLEPHFHEQMLQDVEFELDHPDSRLLATLLSDLDRMVSAFLEHYAKDKSAKAALCSAMGILDETERLRSGRNRSPDDLGRVLLAFRADCSDLPVEQRVAQRQALGRAKGTRNNAAKQRSRKDARTGEEMDRLGLAYIKQCDADPHGLSHPKCKDLVNGAGVQLWQIQRYGISKIQRHAQMHETRLRKLLAKK